jgi:hypothetical protein
MNLNTMKDPAGAQNLVAQTLTQILARPGTPDALRLVPASNLASGMPHLVFDMGLADVLKGASLPSLNTPGACRYLIQDTRPGGGVVAAIELELDSSGYAAKFFRSVNCGPFVDGFAKALNVATRQSGGPYNLHLLRVPALYVMALWLVPAAGEAVLVPIDPKPTGLSQTTYNAADFLAALKPLAQVTQKNFANANANAKDDLAN